MPVSEEISLTSLVISKWLLLWLFEEINIEPKLNLFSFIENSSVATLILIPLSSNLYNAFGV